MKGTRGRWTDRSQRAGRQEDPSGSTRALVQDPSESLPPTRTKARSNLDLVSQFGSVVHPEPGRQCGQRGRVASDLIRERKGQFSRNSSRCRRLPEKRWKVPGFEEVLEGGRSLWE